MGFLRNIVQLILTCLFPILRLLFLLRVNILIKTLVRFKLLYYSCRCAILFALSLRLILLGFLLIDRLLFHNLSSLLGLHAALDPLL